MSLNTTIIYIKRCNNRHEFSFAFMVWKLLLETKQIYAFLKDNPKKLVLCIMLSFSVVLVLTIIYNLVAMCCTKSRRRRRGKLNIEHQGEVPLEQYDVTRSLDEQSFQTELRHAVTRDRYTSCQEYRLVNLYHRSNSMDESTQTDDFAVGEQLQGVSTEESEELGCLVDVMKYFNSQLEQTNFGLNESSFQKRDNNANFVAKKNDQTQPSQENGENASLLEKRTRFQSTNQSELSYETSTDSITGKSSETIIHEESLRRGSIARKPKLGVRGDGYSYIISKC